MFPASPSSKAFRSLLMTLPHTVGSLKSSLDIFSKYSINLTKIESRPSKNKQVFDFVVDVDESVAKDRLEKAINELLNTNTCETVKFIGANSDTPWFPRKITDIDTFTRKCMEAGAELDSDHPGFKDEEYKERRKMIAEIALNYKQGTPIPRVKYTKAENDTWRIIYQKLTSYYPKYACSQFNYLFPLFQQNCGFLPDAIPQLQDVNDFLLDVTGFKLRPVSGLLSARDFLNGLAFRVFHSTQYIRHHSKPLYTPEPDVVHELMGHSIMLADPDFADFSQTIGLASLGASDEEVEKLVRIYWYTLEFGIVKEKNKENNNNMELKAFGAGLLSSFGELEYSCGTGIDKETGKKCEYIKFSPEEASERSYPITCYQPVYFVVDSLESCKEKIRSYVNNQSTRPFNVKYNPYTNSVEVLDTNEKLVSLSGTIQNNIELLRSTLKKLNTFDL
ncbi:hypothetical protein ABK040_002694 [Willaertia magna]